MTAAELALALVRTTLATSAAALVAWLLLARFKVASTRVHRAAWALVILQGWLVVPWTFEIQAPRLESAEAPQLIEIEAGRGRESFATSGSQPMESYQSQKTPDPVGVAPFALIAWFLGAAALISTRLRRYWQLLQTLPRGDAPLRPEWKAEWRRQLRVASVRPGRVELRMTEGIGPLVCFVVGKSKVRCAGGETPRLAARLIAFIRAWSYLVLAPTDLWTVLTSEERTSILRHELAHLQRRDLWKSLAIRLLALPQWFNPLARLAVRRFDEAGEWACDEVAAGRTAEGSLSFANSLLRAAEFARVAKPQAAVSGTLAIHGGVLSRRIHRLVTPRFKEESKMKPLIVPVALTVLAVIQSMHVEYVAAADEAVERPLDLQAADPQLTSASETPYIIESPDALMVDLVAGEPRRGRNDAKELAKFKAAGQKWIVVDPDGQIDLVGLGKVHVAGLTVDATQKAIEAKLNDHFDAPKVHIKTLQYNSKVAFIVVCRQKGDEVNRITLPYPLTVDTNVSTLLHSAAYAEPIDFTMARIGVSRRDETEGESVLPVTWDAETGDVAATTNYAIKPNDRIIVDVRREVLEKARKRASASILEIQPNDILVVERIYGTLRPGNHNGKKLDDFFESQKRHELIVDAEGKVDFKDLIVVAVAGLEYQAAVETMEAALAEYFDHPKLRVGVTRRYDNSRPIRSQKNVDPGDSQEDDEGASPAIEEEPVEQGTAPRAIPAPVRIGEQMYLSSPGSKLAETEMLLEPRFLPKKNPRKRVSAAGADEVLNRANRGAVEGSSNSKVKSDTTEELGPISGDRISILPHDRIRIEGLRAVGTGVVPAAPQGAKLPGKDAILFQIEVIEDLHNNFTEFDSLRTEHESLIGDSETILGAIRILEKNELIKVLTCPQVMTQIDRPARLAIGDIENSKSPNQRHWLEVEAKAYWIDDQLCVSANVSTLRDSRSVTAAVERVVAEGKSIVVRARSAAKDGNSSESQPIYVVVTPTPGDRTPSSQKAK